MTFASAQTTVSVVTPTYNCADFLRQSIASALGQTYKPLDVVVVDDGSTDNTKQVCAEYGTAVRYYHQQNDGTRGNGARAKAILQAKGDWIALLDHDDRWLPNKLERQMQVATAASPDVGLIFCGASIIDAHGKPTGEHFDDSPSGDVFHKLLAGQRYCASSALIRRASLDKVRRDHPGDDFLLNTQYYNNDTYFWLRICRYYQAICLKDRLTEYRYYGGNDSSDRRRLMATDITMLEAIKKHLHPGCQDCKAAYAQGRSRLRLNLARAHFDVFITQSRHGRDCYSSLAESIRTDWRILTNVRRIGALSKAIARSAARIIAS